MRVAGTQVPQVRKDDHCDRSDHQTTEWPFSPVARIAKKIKSQVLTSLKTLTNFKILPVTLFKELVATFRNPPVTVKLAPESGTRL
jgi:hypothetical protein